MKKPSGRTLLIVLAAVISAALITAPVSCSSREDAGATGPTGEGVNVILQAGHTLVPLRYVAEWLGADVAYEGQTATTTLEARGKTVILKRNSRQARINGNAVQLVAAPIVRNGVTYVPVRLVSEALGAKVDWNGQTQVVTISHPTSRERLLLPLAAAQAPATTQRTAFRPLEVMNKGTERAYLAYKGKPLFAFGPMNEEAVFFARHGSDLYNVPKWAKWQQENGMNYVRCYPASGYGWSKDFANHPDYLMPFEKVSEDPLKFDLNRFNKEYWDNFEAVLATMRKHDVIVHLQLIQQCYFELDGGNRWQFNFWNPIHNVNDFTKTVTNAGGGRHPWWEQIGDGSNPELRAHYLRYLDHILNAIGDKGNVIIDFCNEMGDGGLHLEKSKQWVELTLDHIEAWKKRTGNTVIVGQDAAAFPDGDYLRSHPRMDVAIGHGNYPPMDWRKYKKPVVLVNLHLRRFILSYGQDPERLNNFRKARWRALLSRVQGVGDYQKEWRTAQPGTSPQFDRDARLLRAFFNSLVDYPNILHRNESIESGPGENKYCLASEREAIIYMESNRFEENIAYEAQTLKLRDLPLRGNQVEVIIYAPNQGELSKTRRQLTGGRIDIDLPAFTDDMAVRLVAL